MDAKNQMYFKQLVERAKELNAQDDEARSEFATLQQEMLAGKHAKVIVQRDIYPGTVVSISDLSIVVKEKRSFCTIERKNGEIVFANQ